MKKFILVLSLIFSLIMIVIGAYVLFNIYFVVSTSNNMLYDGFGNSYVHNEPHSPYTLIGFILLIGGISLMNYSYNKFKSIKNKNGE